MSGVRRVSAGAWAIGTLWMLVIVGSSPASAQPSPTPTPNTSPTGAASECVVCHSNPQIIASTGESRPGLYVLLDTIQESVHSSFTCVTCHSSLTSTMHAKRDAARGSCATCHTQEAKMLAEGEHGDADAVPRLTCVSCHGNHDILSPGTEEFDTKMAAECSMCHSEMDQRFMSGNPFGMETHLGRTDVATCWTCHRAHLVLPVEDPRSPVNPANILSTCRKCHEDAPANFAGIEIHVASSPVPSDSRLRMVTLYMLLILIGTFAFFGYHTVLQIRHELEMRRARGNRPGPLGGPS
jgi:hypothetical protein